MAVNSIRLRQKPSTTASFVVDALRQSILQGQVSQGERIRQDATALQFGVSQMIVREAFKDLVNEGLLQAEPRRGVSVTVLSVDEALEITTLRSILEPQILEWAMPNITDSDCQKAENILRELDIAVSIDDIVRLNEQFHMALYSPSKRQRTLDLISSLRLNFERYLRYTWTATSHRAKSQEEHHRILELCRSHKAKPACRLLKDHIVATGELLIEKLRRLDA
ncbi:GntR family transcriptional regulator [Rhizobium sullae]|uniref:GntR family transcriptional regulator n=1 Tax=Rhizobium sullae TaxID=50338 RepID=UPI001FCD665D|nr:GntR family transcriptional regulator [Rhizobium sullae]